VLTDVRELGTVENLQPATRGKKMQFKHWKYNQLKHYFLNLNGYSVYIVA